MALTSVDKTKISKYLRDHAVEEIYYIDLCDAAYVGILFRYGDRFPEPKPPA